MLNRKNKILCAFLCALLLSRLAAFPVFCDKELSLAESAILIEGNAGNVLYQRNADAKLPMASTTKIMTALTALRYKDPSEVFTVPAQAVGCEGTSAYLELGERYTLHDLLIALMLQSANDAAVTIAMNVASDIKGFCVLMNQYARELGLSSTNFQNPHGLSAEEHYTSARELAAIALEAHKEPTLRNIIKTKSASIKSLDGKIRTFSNHNKLLFSYKGACGVKTGYTKKSGRCLVSSAERDGLLLIAVTLNSHNDWQEHSAMLDFGFSSYAAITSSEVCEARAYPVVGRGEERFVSVVCEDVCFTLKKEDADKLTVVYNHPRFLYAPVKAGEQTGVAEIRLNGVTICRTKILADHSVQ